MTVKSDKLQLKAKPHHLKKNIILCSHLRSVLLTIKTSQWAVSLIRSAVGPSTLPRKPDLTYYDQIKAVSFGMFYDFT